MKFFHVPVTSFEDATANFEQAGTAFLSLLAANSVRFALGKSTAAWSGTSVRSNQVTVAHGLGVIPTWYGAFPNGPNSAANDCYCSSPVAADATNIYIEAWTALGVTPANGVTIPLGWAAVG